MTNVDSQRIKEIRDNTRAMAEAFGRIADALAEALELYVSTQTETQNSNSTFEKDECAKEYEELGLKELKELIKADHKDENSSEIPNNSTISKMEQVDWKDEMWTEAVEDEPQTDEEYINNLPWTEVGNGEQTDEPQTEEWYTFQDEQEYNARHGKE